MSLQRGWKLQEGGGSPTLPSSSPLVRRHPSSLPLPLFLSCSYRFAESAVQTQQSRTGHSSLSKKTKAKIGAKAKAKKTRRLVKESRRRSTKKGKKRVSLAFAVALNTTQVASKRSPPTVCACEPSLLVKRNANKRKSSRTPP